MPRQCLLPQQVVGDCIPLLMTSYARHPWAKWPTRFSVLLRLCPMAVLETCLLSAPIRNYQSCGRGSWGQASNGYT